MTILPSGRFIE